MRKSLLTICLSLLAIASVSAQKVERAYLRKANSLYRDSSYVDSEVMYRKAIDVNGKSFVGHYNLGNNLMEARKYDEAAEEYKKAVGHETDKASLADAYYNMGVALQKQQKYAECIDAYKNALKNDPNDADAKYNLTKALMMMQQQQNQQQNQEDKEQQEQQQQQQDQNKNQNDNKDNKQDENQQEQQQQEQQDQSQGQQEDMSKETAEQILNAIMEDEKRVNEEVQRKMNRATGYDLENNW